MFLKPANSDMENGFKKFKNVPSKNHKQRKLETGKKNFLKGTRILHHTSAAGGQTPHPLADFSAKNASFFLRAP